MGGYTIFSATFTLLSAAICFSLSFLAIQKCLRSACNSSLMEKEIVSISMRCVSALQAICCCISGVIIINECQDLVYQSHWLTDTYVLIGTGYLLYDTWATYRCFVHDTPSAHNVPLKDSIRMFLHRDPAMMFHHIGLPFIYLPVVMYFRGGVGDGLIGCFMMIEATVPFISLREILVLLKLTKTWTYLINGVLTLVVYTLSRIVIFPWMCWMYGRQIGRPWYEVPFLLKPVCIAGSAVFLTLYLYWWFVILSIAKTEVFSFFTRAKKATSSQNGFSNDKEVLAQENDAMRSKKGTKLH